MLAFMVNLLKKEQGQGMVEYGLIIALVALAVVTVLGLLGGELTALFNRIVDTLSTT